MRRHGRMIPAMGGLLQKVLLAVSLLAGAGPAAGCATTAPVRLDLDDVAADPQAHRNKRVELVGFVQDYEAPRGDVYRTLHFTLGPGPDENIQVGCSGYTVDAIEKASRLVAEAFETREAIAVIGKVKVDKGAITGYELQLESVRYKGQEIVVTRGYKTRPGFEVGGWHFTPSIGVQATITP